MKKRIVRTLIILNVLIQLSITANSQEAGRLLVTTGASFLTVNPDSKGSSLGASGVASSPDLSAQYWNAAKYQFVDAQSGVSASYSPWLRNIFDDMYLASLSAFKRIGEFESIGTSLRYYTGGSIEFQELGSTQKTDVKPFEFAFDVSYIRQLSESHSASLTFRYVHSDLKLNQSAGSEGFHASHSIAADLAMYYQRYFGSKSTASCLRYGLQISNIGSKISYSDDMKYFSPTMFRAGVNYSFPLIENHYFAFGLEMSKFLIPSKTESYNQAEKTSEDSNYSVIGGMFRSFTDSPDGFKGEMKEMNWSVSMEYIFQELLFARLGYFIEHPENGNRKFLGTGVGLKYKNYKMDLSYIIPNERYHPLANTFQISIGATLQ